MKTAINLSVAILLVIMLGSLTVEQLRPVKVPSLYYPKSKKERK